MMLEGFDSKLMKDSNVLFITTDCFRADYAGWMHEKAPHLAQEINKMSKKSVIFKNAISTGYSTPASFPALITSAYPLMYSDYPKISTIRKSIAEILRENGYRTGAFHSNPYLSKSYRYNRGYEKKKEAISETLISNGKVSLSRGAGKYLVSYRTERYKYILNLENRVEEGYDLMKDPNERHNILYEERDLFEDHISIIKKHMCWEKRLKSASLSSEKLKKLKLLPRGNKYE